MALTGHLKIDDIEGESLLISHEGEIEINDIAWSVKQAARPTSGRSRAKAKVSPLMVRKFTDASSPYLALACLQGQRFDEATLTVSDETEQGFFDYLIIRMRKVFISKFDVVGAGDGERIEEEVGLVFGKINYKYIAQGDDQSANDEHEISYDVTA